MGSGSAALLVSHLSPQYGASSSHCWRRQPVDMKASCEYIE